MFDLISALISLIDTVSEKSTKTKKDTARFVRECLPEVKKSLEG